MPENLVRARALFLHAVGKLPPEQWDDYVAGACGDDADLAQQVRHFLQVHREAGSFLEAPAAVSLATVSEPVTEQPGTAIGPYKLLEPIGEGGMGTVWMAQQTEPVKRVVALKLIKAGMDSKQVIARFEAERQALALMDHANIARVLDAGTTDAGRPYFVMDLVKGVPITKYCDEHRLTPRQRLGLFLPVCQAIQHAHQKGIIHRDIKPTNVLVAPYDGKPVVKVIDFGVAKATGQRLTEKTLFTEFGAVVGTLEYMSPEQAELNNQDIDTRSDIYSLGVLLYELLTGTTPLDRSRLKNAAFTEMLRMIREEEPPKPSTRLSESKDALPSISAQRHMEPATLTKLVKGELDWIVMKALDKDRNRRYETANGFALDVQRYLADEPVLACLPSVGYHLWKFAKRHKVALVTSAILIITMLTALAGQVISLLAINAHAQNALEQQGIAAGEFKQRIAALEREATIVRHQSLALSYMHWHLGDVGQADQILGTIPQEKHDWLWHLLKRNCRSEVRSFTPPRFWFNQNQCAFSGNGQRLALLEFASIANEPEISVWDMTTAEKIFTVPKKTTISSLAINHGGTAVATGFSEGHIIGGVLIYEVPTGCLFGRLPVKECRRLSFARSADCLAVSTANDVTLWDWKNAKQLQRIAVANTAALALSPDGELVATVANNILTFWNARDAKAVHTIEDVESFWSPLAFDAQQKRAAFVGRKTRLVKVIDLESGKVVHHFQGSGEITSSLVFHPTEPLLAAGGWDKQVAVWDLKTGVQARKIRGCTDDIGAVAFSETGQWIHTVDRTRVVKTWDALLDQPARRVPIAAAWKGAIDRAGNRLAVTSYDTSLHVIDLRTGKTWSERSPKDPPNCVAFSPDGAILATAGTTGVITLWDPLTGKRLAALPEEGTDWPMVTLAWSPDGKRIATGGQGRQASVWDVVGRRKLFDLGGHSQSVTNVVFSGDGKRLVSGSGGTLYMVWGKGPDGAPLPKDRFKGQLQDIKIWDATTGLLITSIDGLDAKSEGLAINADGSLVTATFADGSVRVFDANTGRLARAFRGELKGLLTLAYHPTDKNCLLTGYANGAVKVWDVEMGREICTLGQHRTQITSLAFTADGTKLVTVGNSDSDVKVWDTMPLK